MTSKGLFSSETAFDACERLPSPRRSQGVEFPGTQPPTFRVREAIHEPVRFDLIQGMREEPLSAFHLLFVQDLDVYEEISIDLHELLVLRQVELRRVGMVSSPP